MPWWVFFGGLGLALVLGGARAVVAGRRSAERSSSDRDPATGSALSVVLGLVTSGFGVVVLSVTAMLVRART